MRSHLRGVALAATVGLGPACGIEIAQMPGLSLSFTGIGALWAGGDRTSDGELLEGAGFSALAVALFVGGFFLVGGELVAAVPDRQAFEVALARGAGPAVTDLASELRLPERLVPRLGALLHGARARIRPWLAVRPADGADRGLARVVREVVLADPELAPYLADLDRRVAAALTSARRRADDGHLRSAEAGRAR